MISCNIISDILPAYLDGSCTEDSRKLVEEHLEVCEKCRRKTATFDTDTAAELPEFEKEDVIFSDYANKVQKRRTQIAFLIVAVVAVATVIFALIAMTGIHMRRSMSPVVYDIEEGTFHLTASDLVTNDEKVSDYILFTNYTQISVTVSSGDDFKGTVMLYNAEYPDEFIMINDVDEKDDTVVFTGLSSANRYFIEYEGTENVEIVVSEGRIVSFWNSLKAVVSDILGM